MKYDPAKHHRRSIRFKGYDYTKPGAYFVTLVSHERQCLFGAVENDIVRLNLIGKIIEAVWFALPSHFAIRHDTWVILPNHLHGIIWICRGVASGGVVTGYCNYASPDASPLRPNGTQPGSLGAILQNFKSVTARKVNHIRSATSTPIWQRNYYEHIIRNERELERIRLYIANNPCQWIADDLHVLQKP
jgi:REP element-mobilizing transposase RayT